MDKIGPMCRGVEDCAAALHAIYGPDGKDITVGDAPFNWNPDTNISSLRIGYLKTEFDGPATPPSNEQQRTQARTTSRSLQDGARSAGEGGRKDDADRAAKILDRFIEIYFVS